MYKYMFLSVFQDIFVHVFGIKKFSVHVYANTYNCIKIIVDFLNEFLLECKRILK